MDRSSRYSWPSREHSKIQNQMIENGPLLFASDDNLLTSKAQNEIMNLFYECQIIASLNQLLTIPTFQMIGYLAFNLTSSY